LVTEAAGILGVGRGQALIQVLASSQSR